MSDFITRVELHGADDDDYKILHAEMAARKFSRSIRSDGGELYKLPTAEYYSFGDLTSVQVRTLAAAAARATGKSFWVLVTELMSAAWILEPRLSLKRIA